MELVVNLVIGLAWPITVLLVVSMFRKELRSLTSRVANLSYKDLKAEFKETLDTIEQREKESGELPSEVTPAGGPLGQVWQRLRSLADVSPRAAVIEAWLEVEHSIVEAARRTNIDKPEPSTKTLEELARRRIIPKQYIDMIDELRRLRNMAAHSGEFSLTATVVAQYLEVAMALISMINRLSKSAAQRSTIGPKPHQVGS